MVLKNIFRGLFFLILILIYGNNLFAQSPVKKTELLIIGTVHFGNPNITEDTIYNALTKYQPDIILWEYHKDFKPLWGLPIVNKLTHIVNKLKIVNVPNEVFAIQKFHWKHKTVPIIGYDGIVTNQIRFTRNIIKTYNQFFDNLYKVKMEKEDSLQYVTYRIQNNEFYRKILINSLEQINRDTIYQKQALIDSMDYQIIAIADKYIVDKRIVNNYKDFVDFRYKRNNGMVNMIKGILEKNKGKRIVVITGLAHKYFMIEQLQKMDDLGIHWNSLL